MSPTGRPATASRSSRSPAGRGRPARPGATPARRTSTSPTCRRRRRSEHRGAIAARGLTHLRPRLLSQPAPSRSGASRAGHRPPQARHHGRREDGRAARQHVHGRRRGKNQDENWEEALQVWPDIVRFAQDHGRKLTIENCPMIFSRDEWPAGHNIAWSPAHLAADPGAVGRHDRAQLRPVAPGLADDRPGALHPRVRAAHPPLPGQGPDDRPRRASTSAARLSAGIGWQVPAPARPGRGRLAASSSGALYRAGYDGDCIIEHEDRVFEGTDELVKRGFLLARDIAPAVHQV